MISAVFLSMDLKGHLIWRLLPISVRRYQIVFAVVIRCRALATEGRVQHAFYLMRGFVVKSGFSFHCYF